MRKTGSEIENDVIAIINASSLKSAVTGSVYPDGTRPKDSAKEDIVVAFLSGSESSIQTGTLNIRIYVPSIGSASTGLLRNAARCLALERLAMDMLGSIASVEYNFYPGETISSQKIPDVDQYFVNIKLQFKRTIN